MSRNSLYDFLVETDLSAYYSAFITKLKVHNAEHLRFVAETDFDEIGMTKPEQRRLHKSLSQRYPESVLGRIKKKVMTKMSSTDKPSTAKTSTATASSPGHNNDSSDNGHSSTDAFAQSISNQHIIPSSLITLCKELGQGEFGKVYQGVWTSSTGEKVQVAVKSIIQEKLQSNPLDFIQEVAIMHNLNHRNVVRLYGIVLETKSLMLVSELAPLRSLLECLREHSLRPSLPVLTLCDYIYQICEGMVYLESKRFIHRDLAARNILAFGANRVKISDFGLSRALGIGEEYYRSNFSVSLKLPIAWCAPECINYLKFTHASDVWAFGIVMWEILSFGFQPWSGMTGQQILDSIDLPKSMRLEQPDACPDEYYALMLQTWEHDPALRPKFADIHSILPDIKPERVQAICDFSDGQLDHLSYHTGDTITVLSTRPREYPDGFYWKGVNNAGKTGLFRPSNTVAYLNAEMPKAASPLPRNHFSDSHSSISLSAVNQSSQNSSSFGTGLFSRASFNRHKAPPAPKLDRSMISGPQGSVFHAGHIGSDGSSFGNVKFGQGTDRPKQFVAPFVNASQSCKDDRQESVATVSNGVPMAAVEHSRSVRLMQEERHPSTSSETATLLRATFDRDASSAQSSLSDFDQPVFQNQTATVLSVDLGPSLLDDMLQMIDEQTSTAEYWSRQQLRNPAEQVPDGRIRPQTNQVFFGPMLTSMISEPSTTLPESEPQTPLLHPADTTEFDYLIARTRSTSVQNKQSLSAEATNRPSHYSAKKSAMIRPMSSADVQLIDEATELAHRLAQQALSVESTPQQRLKHGQPAADVNSSRHSVNQTMTQSYTSTGGKSCSPSLAQRISKSLKKLPASRSNSSEPEKKTFSDTLAQQTREANSMANCNAEKLYSILIDGKITDINLDEPTRLESEYPNATALSSNSSSRRASGIALNGALEHIPASQAGLEANQQSLDAEDEEENPLRRLKKDGNGIVRSFRQGSGRGSTLAGSAAAASVPTVGRFVKKKPSLFVQPLASPEQKNLTSAFAFAVPSSPSACQPNNTSRNNTVAQNDAAHDSNPPSSATAGLPSNTLEGCATNTATKKLPPAVPPKPARHIQMQMLKTNSPAASKSIRHDADYHDRTKLFAADSFNNLIVQLDDIVNL